MVNIILQIKDFNKCPCVKCSGYDITCIACGGGGLVYYINYKTANKAFFVAGKKKGKREALKGVR